MARPRASVAQAPVDHQLVLLDSATGILHRLDPLGALVWSCFDGSGTLAEITDDLSAEFGADGDRVLADVVELARQLGELGLLEDVVPSWERPPAPEPVVTPVAITAPEPRYLGEPPSS